MPWWLKLMCAIAAGTIGGLVLFVIAWVAYGTGDSASLESAYGDLGGLGRVYVGGGALGGVLAGVLLPAVRSRLSAVVVGAIAAQPLFLGFWVGLNGPAQTWHTADAAVGVVLGLLTGGIGGWKFYGEFAHPGFNSET
jgi:hypothetical protein